MSSYQFIEPGAAFPGVSNTQTSQMQRLGLIAEAIDPTLGYAEFMYVRGGSASAPTVGDAVQISSNYQVFQAVSGNTGTLGPAGIAPAALSATNVFGWVQIQGVCDYANLATAGTGAVGAALFIGTTAGRLQTTASATGFRMDNAVVAQYSTTANSNSGQVMLYWPSYNGR